MKKKCLLSGNFVLDIIVEREYPNGFTVGKRNKFVEKTIKESVGNTCGNVSAILPYLGVESYPVAHFDESEQGLKIKNDLAHYGADTRFVRNSDEGSTILLYCTHGLDNSTGQPNVAFRSLSPEGLRFVKRTFLSKDEVPSFLEDLGFKPDVYFYDNAKPGLRLLAEELRRNGTLVYYEPEKIDGPMIFEWALNASDIIKFSHEKVTDISFTEQYDNKLFIRTLGAEGLEFNLCGQGWQKVDAVPNNNVVDWEGAGDWTTSQFIACLCEKDILSIDKMTNENIRECLEKACETASRSVSYMSSKGMIDESDV